MAEFDKSLDKEISYKEAKFETTRIKVSVMSYNESAPKIQLTRENLNNTSGEWRWNKLGRLTKEEALKVIPLIEQTIKEMK